MSTVPVVWTIGHSNHTAERLVELLLQRGMAAVADVRTSPYSAQSTQSNKEQLQRLLESSGIRYLQNPVVAPATRTLWTKANNLNLSGLLREAAELLRRHDRRDGARLPTASAICVRQPRPRRQSAGKLAS